ncbi:MAG TPA: arsenate reductase (glutaredoxin) [Xanthomarina sp.]|nr:arsenate reductase (glutaredoxin) [Xanthomarina sp.]
MTTLYHNPRCSKSREALQLLEEKGESIEIIKYLETPLTKEELTKLIQLIDIEPIELVRTNEKDWKENFKGKTLTNEEIIEAMVAYPKLIERPIAVKGQHAAIGRPPENVLEIL